MLDMSLIPVEGKDGFFRDSKTNAIINKNRLEYQSYVTNRQKLFSDKERIESLEIEMNDIKDGLNEIKTLLKRIIEA